MSETPRLTRKQLREMGKLEVKPDDAPALTDTQELRLRRPSRKEMREAERAEHERNEMLAVREAREDATQQHGENIAAAGSGEAAPARKSVFDRFEPDVVSSSAAANNPPAQETELTPDSGMTAENDSQDGVASQAAEENNSQQPQNIAKEEASVTEFAQTQGESAVDEAADEIAEDDFEFDQGSLRDQLFARMHSADKDLTDADNAANPKNQHDPAADLGNVETVGVSANSVATDTVEASQPEQHSENFVSDESAVENVVTETEVKAENEESSARTWFIFLILAIIAALVGYLAGSWINSWINSTFFAAASQPLDLVLAQGVLLN